MDFLPVTERRAQPRFAVQVFSYVRIVNPAPDVEMSEILVTITEASLRGARIVIDDSFKPEFRRLLQRQSLHRIEIEGPLEVNGRSVAPIGTIAFMNYEANDGIGQFVCGISLDLMHPTQGKQWLHFLQDTMAESLEEAL